MSRLPKKRRNSVLRHIPNILCLLFPSCSTSSAASQHLIRGLDPALASRYTSSSATFECLDKSRVIASDRLNDDFCDCLDGSDEPGTSACPKGKFYCRNKGHQPLTLNASSVDDTFCDCCDGSDEAQGVCKNTCFEAGAEYRKVLQTKAALLKSGLKAKEKYIKQAVGSRQKWKTDLKRVTQEEESQRKIVSELQGKKERIERREAREKAREDAIKKAAEEEVRVKAAKEVAEPEGASKSGENAHGDVSPDVAEEIKLGDPEASEEAASGAEGETEEELSEEEKGRRIAAQWTHDPVAIGQQVSDPPQVLQDTSENFNPSGSSQVPEGVPEVPESVDLSNQEGEEVIVPSVEVEEEEEPEENLPAIAGGKLLAWKLWFRAKLGWKGEVAARREQYRKDTKAAYFAQDSKLTELTREKTELEAKMKLDLGPDNSFLPLVDKCFEAHVEKYVYEICPFKAAAQKEGGMSTSLGSWKGFGPGFASMAFHHGQTCWNGPPRSLQVDLDCGPKEVLSDIEEPSRCEYRGRFSTPAVCSAAEAESVRAQVAAAEYELTVKEEL